MSAIVAAATRTRLSLLDIPFIAAANNDLSLSACRSMSDVTGWAAHKFFLGVVPAVPDLSTRVLDRASGKYVREKVWLEEHPENDPCPGH